MAAGDLEPISVIGFSLSDDNPNHRSLARQVMSHVPTAATVASSEQVLTCHALTMI